MRDCLLRLGFGSPVVPPGEAIALTRLAKPWKTRVLTAKTTVASGYQRVPSCKQLRRHFESFSLYRPARSISFASFLKFRDPVRSWVFKEGFSSDSKSTSVWKHLYAGTSGATKDVIKWQQLLVQLFNLNLVCEFFWPFLQHKKVKVTKVICVCSGFWRLASLPVWCWGRIFKFPSLTVPFSLRQLTAWRSSRYLNDAKPWSHVL